jgi:ABC-type tungstate transport system permease subunit
MNYYAAIAVNPHKIAGVHYVEAMMLMGWLTSPEAKSVITSYKKGEAQLFDSILDDPYIK